VSVGALSAEPSGIPYHFGVWDAGTSAGPGDPFPETPNLDRPPHITLGGWLASRNALSRPSTRAPPIGSERAREKEHRGARHGSVAPRDGPADTTGAAAVLVAERGSSGNPDPSVRQLSGRALATAGGRAYTGPLCGGRPDVWMGD
jgi:hypothetical protein